MKQSAEISKGDLESLWYNRIMQPFRQFSLEIVISIYTTDNPLFYTLGSTLFSERIEEEDAFWNSIVDS